MIFKYCLENIYIDLLFGSIPSIGRHLISLEG